MEAETVVIRPAVPDDAAALLEIYAPYVRKTAITFEYEVPTVAEFRRRMEATLQKYPYLVAEAGGVALGYAYTGAFKGRAAYDWAEETSIYLRENCRRAGLGRRLYTALETVCRARGVLNLNACIGWPVTEDEHLTRNSVEFHTHLGYRLVGEFHDCGYKFGRWYSMVWMEKMLAPHPDMPAPVKRFSELSPALLTAL